MYVTVVCATAAGDTPRPTSSTQQSQVPNAPNLRIRSSNILKRVDTPPAVPPNLRILPIPESALKQGCVFIAQEWPGAVSRSGTGRGAKRLGSRWGGSRGSEILGCQPWASTTGLPASGRHHQRPCRHKQEPRPRPGPSAASGAGNRNRTYDLRIHASTRTYSSAGNCQFFGAPLGNDIEKAPGMSTATALNTSPPSCERNSIPASTRMPLLCHRRILIWPITKPTSSERPT